jgi:glycosyltransferase involved in cell wall biosynthesis
MIEKKKILTIGDHPLSPSGVGIQSKIFIESLLATGRYRVVSLGGAMKHHDYKTVHVPGHGPDWTIYPVDGYGNQDIVRSLLRTERPDVLWFMTDPRFYGWLWEIENEIRSQVPMVYYHVWDNYPYPKFNKKFYESNDINVAISKVTHDIVETVAPDVENHYLPHSVDPEVYKPLPESDVLEFRKEHFEDEGNPDKTIFFWNSRNARRKMSGSVVYWFMNFLKEVGKENACLIMHTDPKDPYGQDLEKILTDFGYTNGEILFSQKKVDPQMLSFMYNMADCTIGISDAEGFGLSTFESLSCGTPIIACMTGGLQEQVTDGKEWFGVGIEPVSKAIIGSQDVPYIYEDRITEEDFHAALHKIHNMSREERKQLGKKGSEHVRKNYNWDGMKEKWVSIIDNACENYGSWEDRKNYQAWSLTEV